MAPLKQIDKAHGLKPAEAHATSSMPKKGMAPLKRFGVCFESVSGDGFNDLTGSLTDECFVRRLVVF